jgi:uncharacterized membrane protein
VGYQVTAIVAGSFAPIIATFLLRNTGSSIPIAIYLAVAAAISLVALLFTKETRGVDLVDVDRMDSESRAARRLGKLDDVPGA